MNMKLTTFFLFLFFINTGFSQDYDITSKLYGSYEKYKEEKLDKRRIKHHEIQPLIAKHAANPLFTVTKVGESIEGRDLKLISIGTGDTNVFLWSQMHGDEPTATQAIFDIFNFLATGNPK